jgi:hypothetical protein
MKLVDFSADGLGELWRYGVVLEIGIGSLVRLVAVCASPTGHICRRRRRKKGQVDNEGTALEKKRQ